jgi:hypothetical protein
MTYLSLTLTQLRATTNAIKNSSTLLLPQWRTKLKELGMKVRIMPCDVSTRWNSTFDMLDFAIAYRAPLDDLASNRDFNLRKYELDDDEWAVAIHLRDTLKACILYVTVPGYLILTYLRSSSMPPSFSLVLHQASAPLYPPWIMLMLI